MSVVVAVTTFEVGEGGSPVALGGGVGVAVGELVGVAVGVGVGVARDGAPPCGDRLLTSVPVYS